MAQEGISGFLCSSPKHRSVMCAAKNNVSLLNNAVSIFMGEEFVVGSVPLPFLHQKKSRKKLDFFHFLWYTPCKQKHSLLLEEKEDAMALELTPGERLKETALKKRLSRGEELDRHGQKHVDTVMNIEDVQQLDYFKNKLHLTSRGEAIRFFVRKYADLLSSIMKISNQENLVVIIADDTTNTVYFRFPITHYLT